MQKLAGTLVIVGLLVSAAGVGVSLAVPQPAWAGLTLLCAGGAVLLVGFAILANASPRTLAADAGDGVLYADPLLVVTSRGLRVRRYYLTGGDKVIEWGDLGQVRAATPTLWNGKWRLWGSGSFSTWLACDFERPIRQTIFFAHLRSQRVRVGFTAHDAGRVKELLAGRGVLLDEQAAPAADASSSTDASIARSAPAADASPAPAYRSVALWSLLALLGLFVAQSIYYYPRLPDRVAMHFDVRGHANGWGSRGELITVITYAGCFVGGLFLVFGLTASRTRAAARDLGRYFLWFGSATVLLLGLIAHFCFRANVDGSHSIGLAPLYALPLYLAFVIGLAAFRLLELRPRRLSPSPQR